MSDLCAAPAHELDDLAQIIDPDAFTSHALTWKPGPGDFPSNWEHRRNVAYRKAEQVAALVAQARRDAEDARGGYRVAADSADRFRDVLSECLGHPDENPGDDVLVAELRKQFGKTGPEPTRWRDFCAGARATVDQINAARADAIARAEETA